MRPDICLTRCVVQLRLEGHDFDAIALALAESAVDALVAAGFRGGALDNGIAEVVDAMWGHAAGLRHPPQPRAPLTLVTGGKP
ncbi:hypothetical protein V5F53_08785 [Xanthobacter sp. V4C-4]|uniref:hypothetical protein n=1 Tax=Xanthobacter cornucopiae TaxID=3119924 RepID=UPI00372B2E80